MTGRELVKRTVRFQTPERFAFDFPGEYGSDFYICWMDPSPDGLFSVGTDEWGAVWDNVGSSHIGQVVNFPLKDWKDLQNLKIPDVNEQNRWKLFENLQNAASDKFVGCWGVTLFERVVCLRGVENAWTDPYEYPEELEQLLDILVDMNIKAIDKCKELGVNGYFIGDDWGLQNALILPPKIFRQFWKPRYERVFRAAHEAGLVSVLHSCGYIVDILDDLIEAGLDIIHMDQQEHIGLELLDERFGGRITFFSPVDIQKTMVYGTFDDIRKYCRKMVKHLWRPEGGFMPRWYTDPKGAGHSMDAVNVMCEEFLKINYEIYGRK